MGVPVVLVHSGQPEIGQFQQPAIVDQAVQGSEPSVLSEAGVMQIFQALDRGEKSVYSGSR